jgi:hypothetical protein
MNKEQTKRFLNSISPLLYQEIGGDWVMDSSQGYFDSGLLRVIADELDRRNNGMRGYKYVDDYPDVVGEAWEEYMTKRGHNVNSHRRQFGECEKCKEYGQKPVEEEA